MKIKKFFKNQKGFTIIEVALVLAIGALIFLVVFLAVPALQRNQRNDAKKRDVSNVVEAIASYISNNPAKKITDDLPGDRVVYRDGKVLNKGIGSYMSQLSLNTEKVVVENIEGAGVRALTNKADKATIWVVSGAACGKPGDPYDSNTIHSVEGRKKAAVFMVLDMSKDSNKTSHHYCQNAS